MFAHFIINVITRSAKHIAPSLQSLWNKFYGVRTDRVSLETVVPPFWKGAALSFFVLPKLSKPRVFFIALWQAIQKIVGGQK